MPASRKKWQTLLTRLERFTARRMNEDFWSFDRTHSFWMSTNHLPRIPDHVINSWLGQSSRVAESHYLTVHQEHWDKALNLSHHTSPITATTGTFSDHHEIEETNDLIGDDGMCYADQYARKDSNLQPSVPKTDALSNCATDA